MRNINRSFKIPGDDIYKFRARAAALLEKWTPALFEHAKTCCWIIEGETDLVYVPQSDLREYDRMSCRHFASSR